MAATNGPVLDFGPAIRVVHEDLPLDANAFAQFERGFAPFVANRQAIYDAIPGGSTWPSFEPPREKILEYYLTVQALALAAHHTYVDVASCLSLFPNFAGEHLGAEVVRQDLLYQPGLHTVEFPRIASKGIFRKTLTMACLGGDACAMPLPEASADAIALHCSFEHFEGDADIRFAREAMRVIRPGGRFLIIPFYCGNEFSERFVAENAPGCQFQRFYDPPTFARRVLGGLQAPHHIEMRYYRNVRQIDPGFYCDYSVAIVKDPA